MIYPKHFPLHINNSYNKEVYNALHKFAADSEDYDVFFSLIFFFSKIRLNYALIMHFYVLQITLVINSNMFFLVQF